jgi:ABC-type nitrate/sulfonate/bicarbonate transport system substrate-binding protein
MKKSISIFALITIVILLGCNSKKNKVTLAASKNLWNCNALIAIDQKFFEEEGLDVAVSYLDAGRFCMDAVLSKSADFGNVVDVNVGYLAYSENKNVILINEISGCLASEIVARKSRGINSPADLKGKSFAYSPGTTSDVFAHRFLAKYGISPDSVRLVKIQPKGMVAGMIANDGPDASSTWQPFSSSMAKGLGNDFIVFQSPEIYTAREFTAVRADWAKENKDLVISYLKALKKANDFAVNHKEDAQKIVAKMTGLDLEVVKAQWEPYQLTFAYDKEKYLKEITQIGEDISRQEEYKGKKVPDYSVFLDDTYYKAVK